MSAYIAMKWKPLRQIGWLFAIWLASVVTLAIVAVLIRLVMSAAGLTT